VSETGQAISLRYRQQLRENLMDSFSLEEVQSLCFDLGIEFDDLEGRRKTNKVESLLSYMERRDRIPDLVRVCSQKRPNVVWTFQARVL
jgi:hypothetical protein